MSFGLKLGAVAAGRGGGRLAGRGAGGLAGMKRPAAALASTAGVSSTGGLGFKAGLGSKKAGAGNVTAAFGDSSDEEGA